MKKLDLRNVSKELILIFDIINKEQTILKEMTINEDSYNWDHLINLSIHHRVFSYIYPKIKALNCIPSRVHQVLLQQYKSSTIKMLHFIAEMKHINTAFNLCNIPLLFLKGPILAKSLYGDISLRTSCDIDVLIPIEDLKLAEKMLLELGYVKEDYIETILNDWKWRHHHLTFFHPEKGIKFELHWRLGPGPGVEPTFNELWKRRRESDITGSNPVCYLGVEDLFVFLVSHGARHGWSRLRWLLDIKKIVNQGIDSDLLLPLLRKYQSSHLAGQALILTSSILGTTIPANLQKLMDGRKPILLAQRTLFYFEREINLHSEPLDKDISVYHGRYLMSLKTVKQKILFFLSCLHPYSTDLKTLPLPKPLHFLYFPLRPFLWLFRYRRNTILLGKRG
ncbi:nucleotidyltransferase family protein [Cytobacillus suaedae]|nr:nucleotidyltransferase family protein [Cytobacillus suaedae]